MSARHSHRLAFRGGSAQSAHVAHCRRPASESAPFCDGDSARLGCICNLFRCGRMSARRGAQREQERSACSRHGHDGNWWKHNVGSGRPTIRRSAANARNTFSGCYHFNWRAGCDERSECCSAREPVRGTGPHHQRSMARARQLQRLVRQLLCRSLDRAQSVGPFV